jgi:hypothetical protein
MMDSLYIGATPYEEECAQVGAKDYDYETKARKECQQYIAQLRRQFGVEPGGAHLYIKRNPHDFGTYLSVECKFDGNNQVAVDYAYKLEAQGPAKWDDEARKELGLDKGHHPAGGAHPHHHY